MNKRLYRAKVVLFTLSVISVMGMTACSFNSKEGTAPEAIVEPKTTEEETPETVTTKTKTEVEKLETEITATVENGKEDSAVKEIIEGDPIVGIVDKYADNIIIIRDGGDQDLIYYFSTQSAQLREGDSPIAAGDIVEITYRGVMGDEEHPGLAVKVVRVGGNEDNTSITASEILAYITDFGADSISIDAIEWVTVPSSRANELGIKEEDGPSGFYIYNPDILTEQFTLSADCTITVLDWQNSYEPQTISAENFFAVLQERGEQNNFIPYAFTITNGTMTEISEHYVP